MVLEKITSVHQKENLTTARPGLGDPGSYDVMVQQPVQAPDTQ